MSLKSLYGSIKSLPVLTYNFPATGLSESDFIKFNYDIESSSEQIIESFTYSILLGEYIDSETKTLLENIRNEISAILDSIHNRLPNEQILKGQSLLKEKFLEPVQYIIRQYKYLMSHLDNDLQNRISELLFDKIYSEQGNPKILSQNNGSKTLHLIRLCDIAIAISIIDHRLTTDKKQLSDLVLYHSRITETINIASHCKELVIDKCALLIKKVNYRFQEDNKNFLYGYNHQYTHIDSINFELKYCSRLHNTTIQNFNIKLTKDERKKIPTLIKAYEAALRAPKWSFKKFHTIAAMYISEKNYERIENLYNQFNEFTRTELSTKRSLFDKKAIDTNILYFSNLRLTSLIKYKKEHHKKIRIALDEITRIQLRTNISNYYPYLTYCEYLADLIRKGMKDKAPKYQQLLSFYQEFEEVLDKAFITWIKCRNNFFIAYQLPASECLIKTKNPVSNLFIASSFILPINYELIERTLTNLQREITSAKQIIDMHISIEKEKESILEVKNQIATSDRKSIEILSIFSAVTLFSAGSIQIFKDDGSITFDHALKWMLTFSYSLVLFALIIWMFTRDSKKDINLIHWLIFIFLCLGWFSCCYMLLHNPST